jgi:hypothetical protein
MGDCKDDCEALMSAVLPVAEGMLSERGRVRPFGSTLSVAGDILRVGGSADKDPSSPDDARLIREFEAAFRDGAQRGELTATALVHATVIVPPGKSESQTGVAVHLDHRDHYSLVVTFPYHFSATGELVIEEPFATPGEARIFAHSAP